MSDFAIQLPTLIVASLVLSATGILAWTTLKILNPGGYRIYRVVWLAVLVQGVMLLKISIDVPVLEPELSSRLGAVFALNDRQSPVSIVGSPQEKNAADHGLVVAANSVPKPISSKRARTPSDDLQRETRKSTEPAKVADVNWPAVLFNGWLLGTISVLLAMLMGYTGVLLRLRRATPASPQWQQQCNAVCSSAGLRLELPLVLDSRLGPALVLTPRGHQIVVPASNWASITDSQREAVLRHEIEHFKRADILISLFGSAVVAIHWFNPFAWLALRQLNAAAEWACDAAAANNAQQQSDFARVLLSFSTSNRNCLVGAHGFGSSDLKVRIQKLMADSPVTSRFNKIALATLTIIILLSGWVNLRLIAESAAARFNSFATLDDIELEKHIASFGNQLSRDGALNQKLWKTIDSPAGKIAIGQSVAQIEDELRHEAAKEMVPDFFQKMVNESFRDQVAIQTTEAQSDIRKLESAFDEIKSELVGTSAADKLFLRFLRSESAAKVLYFKELRRQMRPGRQIIMDHLGRFLATDENDKLVVRESAKSRLLEQISKFGDVAEHLDFLRSELKLLGEEMVETDEVHSRCKQRLMASRGAPVVLAMSFENTEPMDNQITNYLEDLDGFFEDGPDGLVISNDARDHLVEAMDQMDALVRRMDRLREPVAGVVNMIDVNQGESEKKVKEFLSSEFGLAVVSMRIELESGDADSVVKHLKSEILQQSKDGYVVREDRQEEIAEFSRQMLRATRNLRRQLRIVDTRTKSIDQEKLGDLLGCDESKLILIERVHEYMQGLTFDAWPIWVERHFELSEGKYHVRQESQDLVEFLAEESSAIEQELANDDF